MNPLIVFPYKNMQTIVELVASQPAKVRAIQNATGMCFFDSTEVSDMLCHLTSYGSIIQTEEGWIRKESNKKCKYGTFRERFLTDAETLLRALGAQPKTIDELVKETALSEELIQRYLSFLSNITKNGVITRMNDNPVPSWGLASD